MTALLDDGLDPRVLLFEYPADDPTMVGGKAGL